MGWAARLNPNTTTTHAAKPARPSAAAVRAAGVLQVFAIAMRKLSPSDIRAVPVSVRPTKPMPLGEHYDYDGASIRRTDDKVRGKAARRADKARRRQQPRTEG